MRGLPLQFREVEDIVSEIKSLYDNGALYFRLEDNLTFMLIKIVILLKLKSYLKEYGKNVQILRHFILIMLVLTMLIHLKE